MVMWIKKIEWVNKSVRLGDFWVTDGHFECLAFGDQCYLEENDRVITPLAAGFCENIMVSEIKEPYIQRMEGKGFYTHYCIGKLINKHEQIIEIGGLKLRIGDYIPTDIEEGNYVEFFCHGIDL